MRNPHITFGILGFLTCVFCVDIAISDAQIFRRRLCNPCWQQPQCCPQRDPCCYLIDTPLTCNECSLKWDGAQWEELKSCGSYSCCCTLNVQDNPNSYPVEYYGICAPLSEVAAIDSEFTFDVALSVDTNFNIPKEYFRFTVPENSRNQDINMSLIKISAGYNCPWKITVRYRSSDYDHHPAKPDDYMTIPSPPGYRDVSAHQYHCPDPS